MGTQSTKDNNWVGSEQPRFGLAVKHIDAPRQACQTSAAIVGSSRDGNTIGCRHRTPRSAPYLTHSATSPPILGHWDRNVATLIDGPILLETVCFPA